MESLPVVQIDQSVRNEQTVFAERGFAATIETLRKTFGALPAREEPSASVLNRGVDFPEAGETVVRHHRGDANQAAAVIAWPSGSPFSSSG